MLNFQHMKKVAYQFQIILQKLIAQKKCDVEYLDYNGKKKVLNAEGLLATCIQHEMDHLEGILFIDYLSKLKKTMIIKKLSKQKEKPDRIIV